MDGAWDAMLAMTQRLAAALTAITQRLPADFPMELAPAVFLGVRQHLAQFNRRHLPADEAAEAGGPVAG